MSLIRLIDGINEVVGKAVSFIAVIFAGMIIYDVIMRYGFNAPTTWAFDLTKMLYGFYFVMLGGYALRHGAHVRAAKGHQRARARSARRQPRSRRVC